MYSTSKMTDQQFLDFVTKHPVSGGCGTHGAENAAAAQQTSFTNSMISQAQTVFGADSGVFNSMKNAYSQLLAAGPNQQGFGAAELGARNAAAITNAANQTRFAMASVAGRQAGAGGGNAPNASGIGSGERAAVANAGADLAARSLNQIQQEDYAQGNKNWQIAGEGLSKAPSVFGNMEGFNKSAQLGLDRNMANATAADAASNWWVKPVTGLAAAGLNFVAPGLGTAVATGGQGGGGSQGAGMLGGLFSRSKPAFPGENADQISSDFGGPSSAGEETAFGGQNENLSTGYQMPNSL